MKDVELATKVKSAIDAAPTGRLPAIAKALGVEIGGSLSRRTNEEISSLHAKFKDIVDAKVAEVNTPLPENPPREDLFKNLKAREALLDELTALLAAANDKTLPTSEEQLRAEGRIQDDPSILAQLGYSGELPQIPEELFDECARTGGTVVLRFKTTFIEFQTNLNMSLGSDFPELHLEVTDRAKRLAIRNTQPEWINVPNTVEPETMGLPFNEAIDLVPGSAASDPMDTVLMLGYHNLKTGRQTGEQMPGFAYRWTYTNEEDTLVGSDGRGICVGVFPGCEVLGDSIIGLARRPRPHSKN